MSTGRPGVQAISSAIVSGSISDRPSIWSLNRRTASSVAGGGVAGALGLAGPAGIAGAVVLGAVEAARIGRAHYQRWVARVLDRPVTRDLFPAV